MVNSITERDRFPRYSLDRVRELAVIEKVVYVGTRVGIDIHNLGYGLEDVCTCIANLEVATHFRHSERYSEQGLWHDVYACEWSVNGGPADHLYIKLRLGRGCLLVDLCSFHLDR